MLSPSSRPLPHLPLETQAHVLRLCDQGTLAITSRVSLAWLELSVPILHEHVIVRGQEQLEMMIRSEGPEAVLPSIAPFVSLDQTKTFTYAPSSLSDLDGVSPQLFESPVSLQELIIDLRETELGQDYGPIEVNVHGLLHSFDPAHFYMLAPPISTFRIRTLLNFPPQLPWSQLREITFVHALANYQLVDEGTVVDRSPLVDLVFDMSIRPLGEYGVAWLYNIAGDVGRPPSRLKDRPAFGRVQVWVSDENEVTVAKKLLIDCSCTSLNIGVKPTRATAT